MAFLYVPMWVCRRYLRLPFRFTFFPRSVDAISGEWNFKTLTMITFAFVNDKLEVMPRLKATGDGLNHHKSWMWITALVMFLIKYKFCSDVNQLAVRCFTPRNSLRQLQQYALKLRKAALWIIVLVVARIGVFLNDASLRTGTGVACVFERLWLVARKS